MRGTLCFESLLLLLLLLLPLLVGEDVLDGMRRGRSNRSWKIDVHLSLGICTYASSR